jgi:hypothetical protein
MLSLVGEFAGNHADALLNAPRSISAVDASTMTTELSAYNHLSAEVFAMTIAPDAKGFREELLSILRAAKWTTYRAEIGSTDRDIFNVLVELGPKAESNSSDAGRYIESELNSLGIATTFTNKQRPGFTGLGGETEDCSLFITIGPKSAE